MKIDRLADRLVPVNVGIDPQPEGVVRVVKAGKEQPDENTYAKVAGLDFHNGVIEADVRGCLLLDAPDYARGFIGLAFRANPLDSEFECFYIRPTNGRDCQDPARRAHGCQYFSYPGYTFAYFREFGVQGYEAPVDTIALGQWSHLRAEIEGGRGRFFVDGALALEVPALKHGPDAKGAVGLYVDIGTEGFFKNLRVETYGG